MTDESVFTFNVTSTADQEMNSPSFSIYAYYPAELQVCENAMQFKDISAQIEVREGTEYDSPQERMNLAGEGVYYTTDWCFLELTDLRTKKTGSEQLQPGETERLQYGRNFSFAGFPDLSMPPEQNDQTTDVVSGLSNPEGLVITGMSETEAAPCPALPAEVLVHPDPDETQFPGSGEDLIHVSGPVCG